MRGGRYVGMLQRVFRLMLAQADWLKLIVVTTATIAGTTAAGTTATR